MIQLKSTENPAFQVEGCQNPALGRLPRLGGCGGIIADTVDGKREKQQRQSILGIIVMNGIVVGEMPDLFTDHGNLLAILVKDIIVPAKKIALHMPAKVIQLQFGAKTKLLLNRSCWLTIDIDLKSRQKSQHRLMDLANGLVGSIVDNLPAGK